MEKGGLRGVLVILSERSMGVSEDRYRDGGVGGMEAGSEGRYNIGRAKDNFLETVLVIWDRS